MRHALYEDIVPFYRLLDPLADHEEEGAEFAGVLKGTVPDAQSLLELGAGAGNGAHFVKAHFDQNTLTDLSEPMLDLSREINADCEHILGDMRSMRLGRVFDCVLVHDAICHMVDARELTEACATAFAHTRPGGAALFVPDAVTESFRESHEDHEGDEGDRALRCLSWYWDPDPNDSNYVCDYAFLLREGQEVRAVHDRHIMGLFPMDAWRAILRGVGFEVEVRRRHMPEEYRDSAYTDAMFLARRPR